MTKDLLSLSTNEFIDGIKTVASKFDRATYPQQNLPADDWALLEGVGVLLPAVPREYGGPRQRGRDVSSRGDPG